MSHTGVYQRNDKVISSLYYVSMSVIVGPSGFISYPCQSGTLQENIFEIHSRNHWGGSIEFAIICPSVWKSILTMDF